MMRVATRPMKERHNTISIDVAATICVAVRDNDGHLR
jgi:hypothetical protein